MTFTWADITILIAIATSLASSLIYLHHIDKDLSIKVTRATTKAEDAYSLASGVRFKELKKEMFELETGLKRTQLELRSLQDIAPSDLQPKISDVSASIKGSVATVDRIFVASGLHSVKTAHAWGTDKPWITYDGFKPDEQRDKREEQEE